MGAKDGSRRSVVEAAGMGEERLSAGPKLGRSFSLRTAGSCTPLPAWTHPQEQSRRRRSNGSSPVSARKLGASLWEVQDIAAMGKRRQHRGDGGKDFRFQCHRATNGVTRDQVIACDQSTTSRSSLDSSARIKENECSLKTSTELMKVVNQIWSLEEQQESNISLIRELRSELNHAHSRIEELIQEQLADRQVIDKLLKRIAKDKATWKRKEHNMVTDRSVEGELEDERRLRKQLESLHKNILKELSEIEISYTKCSDDLAKERRVRILCQDLCDRLAHVIRCYGQEIQEIGCTSRQNFDLNCQQLLHISEVWLDKRSQMKIAEERGDSDEVNGILVGLACDVESFNQLCNPICFGKNEKRTGEDWLNHESQESLQLNGTSGLTDDAEYEDLNHGIHCFELNKSDDGEVHCNSDLDAEKKERPDETRVSSSVRDKIGYFENILYQSSSSMKKQHEGMGGVNSDDGT